MDENGRRFAELWKESMALVLRLGQILTELETLQPGFARAALERFLNPGGDLPVTPAPGPDEEQ